MHLQEVKVMIDAGAVQTALKVGFVVFTDESTVSSSVTEPKAVRFRQASKQEQHSKKSV